MITLNLSYKPPQPPKVVYRDEAGRLCGLTMCQECGNAWLSASREADSVYCHECGALVAVIRDSIPSLVFRDEDGQDWINPKIPRRP
jgi:hypothetical protein